MLPDKKEQLNAVRRVARVYKDAFDSVFSSEFEAYDEGYNALLGEQYTREQKAWFERFRRPTNVWNIILPIFNRILGDFLLSFQEDRVYPRRGGYRKVAANLERVLRHMKDSTRYKDEMAKTILSGLVKRGCAAAMLDTEKNPLGEPAIKNINEYEIMFDTRAYEEFADDGLYMIRSRMLDVDTILSTWPQHRRKLKMLLKAQEDSAFWEATNEVDAEMMEHRYFRDEKNGQYRVIEFHWKEWEDTEIALNPATQDAEVVKFESQKERDTFFKNNPNLVRSERRAQVIKIDETLPALSFFLNRSYDPVQGKGFKYVLFSPYSGYGKKVHRDFGILKSALPPQKNFNDLKNQAQNIVNKAANIANRVKPAGILNYRQIKNRMNEPGVNIEVDEAYSMEDVFQEGTPPTMPLAEQNLASSEYQLLNEIIGVTSNMKGEAETSQENASLFYQRIKEGQKSLIPVERAIKRTQARLMNRAIKLMQKTWTEEMFVEVVDRRAAETEMVPFNVNVGSRIKYNLNIGEYEVLVSNQEGNPTLRAFKFIQKTEMVQMLAEIFGGEAIDVRWWLSEADDEDIDRVIQRIEYMQQQQLKAQVLDQQTMQQQGILNAAQQRLALDQQAAANVEQGTPERVPEE